LVLFPTLVQGDKAAADIVKNIKKAEAMDFDTMIIGRGGGSIEDLWPFNEESVARAIAASPIPIISSVGHETDTTIADLVADVRAATPTAAAELAVPVLSEEILRIKEKQARLEQAFLHQLQRKKERFERLQQSYIFRQPNRLYEAQSIQLDRLTQQLQQNMTVLVNQRERELMQYSNRLAQANPINRVRQAQQQMTYLQERLQQQMQGYLENQQRRVQQAITSLDLLSPLKTMGRGFTYTTQDEQVVRSVNDLQEKEMTVHFVDGTVKAAILEIEKGEE
jgi:exodeoxyribonuclease VII large subunit